MKGWEFLDKPKLLILDTPIGQFKVVNWNEATHAVHQNTMRGIYGSIVSVDVQIKSWGVEAVGTNIYRHGDSSRIGVEFLLMKDLWHPCIMYNILDPTRADIEKQLNIC